MRVIITKPEDDSQQFCSLFELEGFECLRLPCLEYIKPSDNYAALDKAIRENHLYDWVFFLSKKSAEVFFTRLLELGGQFFHLSPRLKIACVGQATAEFVANEIGFPVNFIPSEFNSDTLVEEFLENYTLVNPILGTDPIRVILPRTETAEDEFISKLEASQQIEVSLCAAYVTNCPKSNEEVLSELDALIESNEDLFFTFTSSEIARNFSKIIGEQRLARIFSKKNYRYISIGPRTSETIRTELKVVDILEAKQASLEAMLDMIQFSHGVQKT